MSCLSKWTKVLLDLWFRTLILFRLRFRMSYLSKCHVLIQNRNFIWFKAKISIRIWCTHSFALFTSKISLNSRKAVSSVHSESFFSINQSYMVVFNWTPFPKQQANTLKRGSISLWNNPLNKCHIANHVNLVLHPIQSLMKGT